MEYVEDHEVSHVVDSHYGIYSAQIFVERFGESLEFGEGSWALMAVDDVKSGPNAEFYCESWCDIMDHATVVLGDKRYNIHEDEGIYLVRDDVEWCEECEWFASKECDCPHVSA